MLTGAIALWLMAAALPSAADLRSPAWYDEGGVGTAPDWHYRVALNVPGGAAVDSTIRVDVDFQALLTRLGIGGTFDSNSPRVVRANGSLVSIQQYTDSVYAGATDLLGNGRGEIRFLLEDNGSVTYQLYFDILENGAKPAWDVNDTINGNFEFSADGQQDPPNWSGSTTSSYDAMAIENNVVTQQNMMTVTTDAGSPGSVYTDESANTGGLCYLLGARTRNEASSRTPSSQLTRTIDVPSTNPGTLQLRYRVKGWDSSDDGAGNWDYLRIYIRRGGTMREIVGPYAGNYTTLPFSPNKGIGAVSYNRSGYGQYNGWDTDIRGIHHAGMSLSPGAEPAPWFTASADLSVFAGRTVTLYIETSNQTSYKSWFHIDDVEWSRHDATLGEPEGFGVNVLAPNDTAAGAASVYSSGDRLVVRVQVDASPTAGTAPVTADLRNPLNSSVLTLPILLFNDGTHGDASANDAVWTNDGSVPADPTYTFLATDFPGAAWQVIVFAKDGSASTLGAANNGLVHVYGQPTEQNQADYYNIDQQVFTLVTPPNLTLLKSVITESDPVNGGSNPKAIPGAAVLYTISASNQGGSGTDNNTVVITDPIPDNTSLFVGDLGGPASGPVLFTDGAVPSGLSYTFLGLSSTLDDITFLNAALAPIVPVPGPDGYDGNVRFLRITPGGVFNGVSGTLIPTLTLRFRVRVD
ncbi:MAG: hypothetical protein P8X55_08275 [Desulfosarcinaceae bacterium]